MPGLSQLPIKILQRHADRVLPRYTSYPTAPHFRDDFGDAEYRAWLADVLYFLFGRPAYLFPLMLSVACFVMFRQRDDEEGRTRANTAVRIGGFMLMLFASCGLTTLHWSAGALRQNGAYICKRARLARRVRSLTSTDCRCRMHSASDSSSDSSARSERVRLSCP